MKILIFGGTGEAREIADRLVNLDHEVTTSLAGKTLEPQLPKGSVRIGGFGDVPRLRAYMKDGGFDWVIDALHPYAEAMARSLRPAAEGAGAQFIRLARPRWEMPEAATIVSFDTADLAIANVPDEANVLVTSGHKGLVAIDARPKCRFFVRLIEAPEQPLAAHAQLLLDRPPYTLDGEVALMREHGISHLITKDGGSDATRAKIDAAAALSVVIYLVDRPPAPSGPWVTTVDDVIAMVQALAS